MTNVIKLKRSATEGAIPSDLADGEIAINLFDELLYAKNADGIVVPLNEQESVEGTRRTFTATQANQTVFGPIAYDPSVPVDVYLSGIKLSPGDFDATTGADIRLTEGADIGQVMQVIAGYVPQNSEFATADHTHTEYEPVFAKNTGFNLSTGTTAGTVAEGDHSHDEFATFADVNHLHAGVYQPVGNYALVGDSYTKAESDANYEPAFAKNTAFNLNFGTTLGTVAEGDHSHDEFATFADVNHLHAGVYQPVGNYALVGDSYTKAESDANYEPAFAKNTAFNLNFGTTAGTVAQGDHSHDEFATFADVNHLHAGVYQPVGNYALVGDSYTKAESDAAYQPAGTYALVGDSYTKPESDANYEPAFAKNTAFNLNFGNTAGTVAEGNHAHDGVYEPVFAKNTAFNKEFGNTAGTVAEGNHQHIGMPQVGTSAGLVADAKIFCFSATTDASGNATVDITSGGFAEILSVLVTAVGGNGTAEETPHGAVVSYTTTQVVLKTLQSAGASGGGLLTPASLTEGLEDSPNRFVFVTVFGN